MALNLNKVIIAGNLTADPELRTTQSGISVVRFTVAVRRRYRSSSEQQPQTDFLNVVAWRQTAEFVSRYFHKGSPICVVGSIQTSTTTDQNGQKRYWTDIVADEVNFVDSKSSSSGSGYQQNTNAPAYTPESYGEPAYQSGSTGSAPQFEEMSNEDDLPF